MKKIVAKFGGSNLKERDDILKIVSAVKHYNQPMVVVVSAFYGITNRLSAAIDQAGSDEPAIDELTDFLSEIKRRVLEANIASDDLRRSTMEQVSSRVEELRRFLLGIHYIAEIPESVRDRIMSYGERLSSLIVSAIFRDNGIDAEEMLPEQMGLTTSGEFSNASVDFERSAKPVSRALSPDRVFVVPGFYGIAPDGRVTLLGRGGSDYSAAAIARCIDAESLDIWKDVNGFMSADPTLVDHPRPLALLSYREAAELSYFGARILHPRTVEPIQERGIPLKLFNILRHGEGVEALSVIERDHQPLVDSNGDSPGHRVKSVTYSLDFGILRLEGSGVGSRAGVLGEASAAIAGAGINIKSVMTTQTSINVFLSEANLARARDLVAELELPTVSRLEALDDYAIVALVGEGLEECEEIAETLILALSRAGIHAKMISIGASAAATYFIVQRDRLKESIRAVHSAFFPA